MTPREKAHAKKVEELISKTGRLADNEVARVKRMLSDARKEIASRMAQTEWDMHHIPELKEAVQRALEGFEQAYGASQTSSLNNAWNAGIDTIDAPLNIAGIRLVAPEISRTSLEIMQGYSADLISGLGKDALKKVNGEIAMGILGQKTPYDVMNAIGLNLDDKSIFKTVFHRAETITRTEMAKVQSAARQGRILTLKEGQTEPLIFLVKKWLSSGKANGRSHHQELNGVTVGLDENFPYNLPYPHAPGLPAAEVINCGCTHVVSSPDWEKLSKRFKALPYDYRAIYD